MNFEDGFLLVHFRAEFLGVSQQNVVVYRPLHLHSRGPAVAFELSWARFLFELLIQKVKEPKILGNSPAERSADFNRKVGSLHLVPAPHFMQDLGDGRKLAFADVLAWEFLRSKTPTVISPPYFLRNAAVVEPAGPPPMIATSKCMYRLRSMNTDVIFGSISQLLNSGAHYSDFG